MPRLEQIGRRTWFGRMAGGFVALWAGLGAEGSRESWAGWLGRAPRRAFDQDPEILPVETEFEFQGITFPCAAFVVVRGSEIAVVDALVPGNADRIGAMILQAGLDWWAVRHVILTHWHFDHVGSAEDIAQQAPQATFWAGEPDIQEITLSRPISPVYDRDEVFGLRIVSTPGHTAGHISILDPRTSSLMTGDAVFNIGGELALPPAAFSIDVVEAVASASRLGALGFERALFAHGPAIERGAAEQIARLAAAASQDPFALIDHRHNCMLHA